MSRREEAIKYFESTGQLPKDRKPRGPMSEEQKKKQSAALKGKHWKVVDGKRVWYDNLPM